MHAKSLQFCPTLCDPMNYSPPGFSVHGILQARILERCSFSSSLYMGFSRPEYWRGVPFPPPGNLPDPGIEPESLTSPALAGRFFTTSAALEAPDM